MESKPTDSPLVSRTCPNCYYPLPRFGKFCSHCGQKYTDGRITVGSLLREFLADTFNLDSKIWRTLLALFVPGKLTKQFFAGKQQRYVRPVRLFFVFAVLTVATVTFFEADFTEYIGVEMDGGELNSQLNYSTFMGRTVAQIDTLKTAYPGSPTYLLDSLQERLLIGLKDSLEMGVLIDQGEDGLELQGLRIANHDLATLSTDSLIAAYEIEGFLERLFFRQNMRLQLKGENFAPYLLNMSVWMMLLLMPFLALLLKILYVRHNYYYVEHLIFSFHTHTFVFLLLIVLMLLDNVQAVAPYMGRLWVAGFLLTEIYFFLSLRGVYGQSRFKTWIKFLLLNLFYLILFTLAFILTIITAALFY